MQMELQDDAIKAEIGQAIQVQCPKGSQSISDKLSEYTKIMNLEGVEDMLKTKRRCMKLLATKAIVSGKQWHNNILQIEILAHTVYSQCVILKICYHTFSFLVTVHFVDQVSPSHQIYESFSGNFSNVYRALIFDKEVALKCSCYSIKNFLLIFKNTLAEYLIFLIASQLNIGPKMEKSLGFDLIVYKNCVQFCMEFCEQNYNKFQGNYTHLQQDLKQGLKKLHSLNIIHFDIKPENICYSKVNKKYVFIDYGLHSIIRQQFGLKTFINFRGSVTFASQEMIECFQKSDFRFIDLYYNDAHCLKESLQQMKKNINSLQMENSALQAFNITKQAILYIYKGRLVNHYFISNQDDKIMKSIQAHFLFLQTRLALEQAETFHLRLKQIFEFRPQKQFFQQLNSKKLENHQLKEQVDELKLCPIQDIQNKFDHKLQALRKMINTDLQEKCSMLTGKFYLSQIDNLKEINYYQSLDKPLLYHQVSKYLQFSAYSKSYQLDIHIAKIFNSLYINYPEFDTLQLYQMLTICYKQLIDYAISRDTLDNISFNIIKYCLQSITVLQCISLDDYLSLIDRIIQTKGSILRKVRMFLSLFVSIEWINSRIVSNYSYFQIMNKVYGQCKQYLNSLKSKDISEEEAQIISYVRLVMMPTVPLSILELIQYNFGFNLFLYHAMTNDYYLVLAQMYLYALYRITSKKHRMQPQLQSNIYRNLGKILYFESSFLYTQSLHFLNIIFEYYLVKQSILIKGYGFNPICMIYRRYQLNKEIFFQNVQLQQIFYYLISSLSKYLTITVKLMHNQHHLFSIRKGELFHVVKKIENLQKHYKSNPISPDLNLYQKVKNIFVIKQFFDAMDKPLANYHQHNLTEQTLIILQIIWELKQMFNFYTDQEINKYYSILEAKIQESKCIECKIYALIYFTTYKAFQKCGSVNDGMQDIFIGNFTYLIKTQPSTEFIVDYLSEYLYMIKHNQQSLKQSPPFKYDYISIIYQTAHIYNYFDIYFYLKRRKNRFKDVLIFFQTLTVFWQRSHQLYFQFLGKIYHFIDEHQRKIFDLDFISQINKFVMSLPLDSRNKFFLQNYKLYRSNLRNQSSRALAIYLFVIIDFRPNHFKLPCIYFVYIWKYISKSVTFVDFFLIPQLIKNITSYGKKLSPRKLFFLIKIKDKSLFQLQRQNERYSRIKIDQRWGNSSKIHQKILFQKVNAYRKKNQSKKLKEQI